MQQQAKTWLVTGGHGFLGKALVQKIPANDRVVALGKVVRDENQSLSISCDVASKNSVRRAFDQIEPNVVVHLAALTGVQRCDTDPSLSFETNVMGTFNVAMASADYKAGLIFASSREVYGETRGEKSAEADPCHPNNFYGATKLIGEQLIKSLANLQGLTYTILRFTNLYGPGGDQYIVASATKKLLAGESVTILGGQQTMNMLHVNDAADAILKAEQNPHAINEIINIGSADDVSVEELIMQLASEVGSEKPVLRKPMRQGDTLRFVPDVSKADRLIGFHSRTALKDGLRDTIDYYRGLSAA